MKFIFSIFIGCFYFISAAQVSKETTVVDVNYLTGNVLPHAPDLQQFVTGHPKSVMVSFSKKTYGEKEWESAYNYPDYGIYFLYQDFKNQYLAHNFAIGAHYNFYFLNRNLIDRFGIQAGLVFTHFSNGRIKSPNSGINTYSLDLGINYNLNVPSAYKKDTIALKLSYKEPIKYTFVLRTGINESSVVNSGQHAFYHVGFFADKRIGRKSALQLGTEIFFSNFYKDFIYYQSVAYAKKGLDANADYKRVGLFIGHELFINRVSIELQVGYYVYQPYKFDIPVYDRLGIKYYITKKIFTGLSVKTHGFLAEASEFVVGVRL